VTFPDGSGGRALWRTADLPGLPGGHVFFIQYDVAALRAMRGEGPPPSPHANVAAGLEGVTVVLTGQDYEEGLRRMKTLGLVADRREPGPSSPVRFRVGPRFYAIQRASPSEATPSARLGFVTGDLGATSRALAGSGPVAASGPSGRSL